MRTRNMNESAPFVATWPGTNLLAWYEIETIRQPSAEERSARNRCLDIIDQYHGEIATATGYTLLKALYSCVFTGLYHSREPLSPSPPALIMNRRPSGPHYRNASGLT